MYTKACLGKLGVYSISHRAYPMYILPGTNISTHFHYVLVPKIGEEMTQSSPPHYSFPLLIQ